MNKPILAITIGDVNGIGLEVTLKSFLNPEIREAADFFIVGSFEIIHQVNSRFGYGFEFQRIETFSEHKPDPEKIDILDVSEAPFPVEYGKITAEAGKLAGKSIVAAVLLCLGKYIDGIVTAPLSKKGLHLGGFVYPGQTEFLAELAHQPKVMMMLVADNLRVGLVTTHLPVKDISGAIDTDKIVEKLSILYNSLVIQFAISEPRIAVTGLNPHAGEEGILGREEIDVIIPALERARKRGIRAEGPFPADTFFRNAGTYDAVLAMYHDQGLIPIKTLHFDTAVNFTAGLPFIRTSPDHGTAYDIAGKSTANPKAMESAIQLAVQLAQNIRSIR